MLALFTDYEGKNGRNGEKTGNFFVNVSKNEILQPSTAWENQVVKIVVA